MKTAVITDSASYLDPEVAAKYNITVLPITVIFGNEQFRDGVDITSQEFLKKLAENEKLPTTAQVTMGQMQEAFDQLSAKGYDEAICVNLSSGITTFYENLVAYSRNVTNIKVYPFDSKIASAGEADLCLLAGQMALDGANADTIIPKLEQLRDTINVSLVVDSLDHLKRTGRISNTSAFFGNMLKIKPILTFDEEGKIVPEAKERTMKQALQHIVDEIAKADFDLPMRISVVDANNPVLSKSWVEAFHEHFPEAKISTYPISPAITVHTGEKAMGVVWDIDWETLSK
ncbi:DegV domain-containing protein [Lentilactobacillus parabuchneri]|jgi:DegV family protein with EDD domain|uniref:DegV domain-containing protein n=3 Tax=Lentilactobacillus TaxID=2767893 RepID=A0A1X1FES0_9LACO|nr:DegV family protein [Lentilactobacillus parabuchneri]APR07509.1 DegV domain-containing protein [Lentilactobacillus parabuchneri]KRM46289.1 degV family protein [Lentilactobacillus parabuchneri DSM 5707 = NBRC 107865]KRN72940.1 degV family protein [Lentilactobacillus parabuchneri]MBW0223939.1 DegV family protein [Lentilactobacillus parabuchneri]MBW0245888.1 DegV family protein [Lentilactobacillus parabuchneri]